MKISILLFLLVLGQFLLQTDATCAQTGRTLNDVRAETYERNRVLEDPRNNPSAQSANSVTVANQIKAQRRAAQMAFRNKILATMTQQDLTVLKVIDGDTMQVGVDGRKSFLHIVGIDAPEEGQAGWEEAKNKLSDLVLGKTVTIKYSTFCPRHTSGVFLTRVIFEGNDVGAYLLKNGLAWYDEAYEVFFNEKEHKENIKIAKQARAAKSGIWKNEDPSEPWNYAAIRGKRTP